MTTSDKTTVVKPTKRDEALVERLFRRMFESLGAVVDRKLGREVIGGANLTTSTLIERMKRAIDERVRGDGRGGRVAPHLLKLKIEWGTHSDAPSEVVEGIKNEILAGAIDHINDNRYRTLAPVQVETITDIFTTGISVEPTFGEFQEQLDRANEEGTASDDDKKRKTNRPPVKADDSTETQVMARITIGTSTRESLLRFVPGGRRLNVGRAADNDLTLDHPSVSKVHAAVRMNADGTLIVADTGSTNGTFINGRRIAYGEARTIESGDTLGFGDTEVRLRRL